MKTAYRTGIPPRGYIGSRTDNQRPAAVYRLDSPLRPNNSDQLLVDHVIIAAPYSESGPATVVLATAADVSGRPTEPVSVLAVNVNVTDEELLAELGYRLATDELPTAAGY